MNTVLLNKKRNMVRYSSVAVASVEVVAVLLIMFGIQLPGVIIGLAALIGGMVFKRKGKKAYQEECCRLQTVQALGFADGVYTAEKKETAEWMRNTHLVPASSQLTDPLLLHSVEGTLRGVKLLISEITFGCQEKKKRQATYSSGVLVRTELKQPVKGAALLLGRYAFKHAALRDAYEKDGLRLSPVGGKEKGWYAMTAGAAAPDAALLEKFDELCAVSKHRAALYVNGTELTAFFNGQFYTGEYALEEEVTEGMFRKHSFAAIVPMLELIRQLNGEEAALLPAKE